MRVLADDEWKMLFWLADSGILDKAADAGLEKMTFTA